ncbi:hypothetical protein PSI22_03330 [Xenorhabdus sp. XENO-7]|uniref:Uncharacterized protein n=1 Tax=Xenorhabdus aichiensis TaxID=3025874 RepID=A0ABT5LZ38_9GAMM|nr:hypothetical protein [Xenorhabdus aichiensis]MDC9620689.1 hypothetical protein [Xenorhabdus aichiensis]
MNIKYFVLNTEFKKLLVKTKDLEAKIQNTDPLLENITLNDLSYNKYFSYPGRFKIGFIIFFITIVYMAFFSGAAVAIPSLLIGNPSYEIKAFSFILSLIISAFISFSHIGLTLSGYYYGPVIQKYTNTVVFFFSLSISYLSGVSDSDFFYFLSIALCCFFIKLILNGEYYSGFIWAKMCVRVERVIFNNELDKIKGFNKKQLREYSRVMKLEKRKKIRDGKRKKQENTI